MSVYVRCTGNESVLFLINVGSLVLLAYRGPESKISIRGEVTRERFVKREGKATKRGLCDSLARFLVWSRARDTPKVLSEVVACGLDYRRY